MRCTSICSRSDVVVPTAVSSSRGTLAGGGGGARVQQVLEDPLAAQHGRGPRRVGRHREDAAPASAPRLAACRCRSTRRNSGPVTPGDAVVAREPFVQERVLRVEEVEDAAVLADDRRRRRARSPSASTGGGSPRSRGSVSGRARADSSARVCSHCPPNCSTSACDFGSRSMRATCASRTAGARSCRASRERAAARRPACWPRGSTRAASPARSRRRRCGDPPASRGVRSRRNRKSGETSTPCSASAMPSSNDSPSLLRRRRRA